MPLLTTMHLLIWLAGGLAAVTVASLLADLGTRDRDRLQKRIDDIFAPQQASQAKQSLFKVSQQPAAQTGRLETWRLRLTTLLEQSGAQVTTRTVVAATILASAVGGLLAWLVLHSVVLWAPAAAVSATIPVGYLALRRSRRRKKLRAQLPDAFDLMSRVIRAGQTMPQAMQGVADDFQDPLRSEFAWSLEQQKLGLPVEEALRDLARRSGLAEMRMFVLAMLVQRQTGGGLAELLHKLAATIRDRFRIDGVIRTLTAEGRMQAAVLMALPPAMLLLMTLLSPNYAGLLWDRQELLVGVFLSEAIGALWIGRIVRIDF